MGGAATPFGLASEAALHVRLIRVHSRPFAVKFHPGLSLRGLE